MVITELVILAFCFFCLLVIGAKYESVLVVLFIVALIFPVAFYHHSWSLWLGFDYLVESLPKYRQYRKSELKHESTDVSWICVLCYTPRSPAPLFQVLRSTKFDGMQGSMECLRHLTGEARFYNRLSDGLD